MPLDRHDGYLDGKEHASVTDQELFQNYFVMDEMARLLGIKVKTLRNRISEGRNHPPVTPEGLFPKDEYEKWNRKRLQHEMKKAS
jgi:hypothetical protein